MRFLTPDVNGKTKCHYIHVGRKEKPCPSLQVHGTRIPEVVEDTYLGDIISNSGKNTSNIKSRIAKGLGTITKIMSMLEKITLGEYYFQSALLLRESLFVNSLLTNAEVWYGLSASDIKQLEDLDKSLLRRFLGTKTSTPGEALYLELGCLDINTILKARRINDLHYLANRKPEEMIQRFFIAQWKYPCKQDWTEQVKEDLNDFNIPSDLEFLKSKSKSSFKKLVKKKAKEFAFKSYLQKKKAEHSKLKDLFYSELKTQKYLNTFTVADARLIFSFRSRMAHFKNNLKSSWESLLCPLCLDHVDDQSLAFECPKLKTKISQKVKYTNIFNENIEKELVENIKKIISVRDEVFSSQ